MASKSFFLYSLFTMNNPIRRRNFLKSAGVLAFTLPPVLDAANAPAPDRALVPTLVRTHELMTSEPNKSSTLGHVWKLHQSATSRTNLVEMRGNVDEHIHPDAEHSLYVISGELSVHAGDLKTSLRAGDYISIPAGLKHGYSVPPGKSALLISMDAPPYDPDKTVRGRK
jgi:quercetin dioxygenase-like cupin family protein